MCVFFLIEILETLKFPLLPTVHALNYWSPDRMMAFMNQYWWGKINKAAEKLPTLLAQNTIQGSLFALLPDIFNCLRFHLRFDK